MRASKIYKLIDRASVISFDIFDTLLVRPYVNPNDLFIHMEQIYNRPGFAGQRQNAESLFYRQNGTAKEADINDIYSMIPDFDEMRQYEMDMELRSISINPEIKKAYDYAINSGKKVVLCSDMYLPQSFICKLLRANNIDGYFKLYLSNAVNHRKDRGDMYDFMLDDLNVKPSHLLHIGDNKQSDFIQPKSHGIRAYLVRKISDMLFDGDVKFERFYNCRRSSIGASISSALVARHQSSGDYWIDFGYKYAGPVAYGYARWIYNTACRHGMDTVLFVARDGYLIEKVFNTFNDKINTAYVYAPRIMNYTANLDYDKNSVKQADIICKYFNQDYGNMSPQEFIENNHDKFIELAKREKQRTGYSKYINSKTKSYTPPIGVVDTISGQLSGQRLIEKESGVKTVGFYVLTLAGNPCVNAAAHCDYIDADMRDSFITDNKCDLVELIFSAPENPVVTMQNGVPVYKDDISESEKLRHEIFKKIERGVLDFTNDVNNLFAGKDIYFLSRDMMCLLDIYATRPDITDINAMACMARSPYADNSEYVPLMSRWKMRPNILARLGITRRLLRK